MFSYSKEYSKNEFSEKQISDEQENGNQMSNSRDNDMICNQSAKNELNLLAKLIGKEKPNESELDFWLNLGKDETIPENNNEKKVLQINELNISQGIHKNKSLENIINDLNIDGNEDNNCSNDMDLLALMDS